jgi:hypothetical protein
MFLAVLILIFLHHRCLRLLVQQLVIVFITQLTLVELLIQPYYQPQPLHAQYLHHVLIIQFGELMLLKMVKQFIVVELVFGQVTHIQVIHQLTIALGGALNNTFDTLGYQYYYNDLLYNIKKPYGASGLTVSLCVDLYFLDDGAFCTGGTCSNVCTDIGNTTYPTLNSGSTGVYVIDRVSGGSEFDFAFVFQSSQFSGFTSSRDLKFRYEVYKYFEPSGNFRKPVLYNAGYFDKDDFSIE